MGAIFHPANEENEEEIGEYMLSDKKEKKASKTFPSNSSCYPSQGCYEECSH